MGTKAKSRRPVVTPDGLSLLSLGLQLTYVLGLWTYSLGERGWPGWLKSIVPDWFPGPTEVLFWMPLLGMFAIGISLLMWERHTDAIGCRAVSRLSWAALIGAGLTVLSGARYCYRSMFYDLRTLLPMLALCLPVLIFIDHLLRRMRRIRKGCCPACGVKLMNSYATADAGRAEGNAEQSGIHPRSCARCGTVTDISSAYLRGPLSWHWSVLALLSAWLGAAAVFTHRGLMAWNGVRPLDLHYAGRRVSPSSAAADLAETGMLLYRIFSWFGLAGLLYSLFIVGLAIHRRDGRSARWAGIAAIISLIYWLLIVQTGQVIQGEA